MTRDEMSAFEEWWNITGSRLAYARIGASVEIDAFKGGAEWMREQCAKVAEQAGYDTLAEKMHGKYIAERIRDGDRPIGGHE